jgi:four helix bundle protein
MRDHTKLRVFTLSDELAVLVYRYTASFPVQEQFGLTFQIRKSAVSIPSNIVEGCARHTEADYLHFLDIAYGSSRELEYQLSLANRLGFFAENEYQDIRGKCTETCKVLAGLIRSLRK